MEQEKQSSGIAAVVLAAGMSRRMGTPKQLLELDGKVLLQHTLENVRGSGIDEIVLVLGFAADAVRQQISINGLKVVVNPEYQQGMGTSLRAGLAAVSPQAKGGLIVLADQPLIRPGTLTQLMAYHHEHQPQILIPAYKGFRGNPVLLDREVFPELMSLNGDVGCRAIFGSHTENIHKLDVDDIGILLDIDSMDDLQKAQEARSSALTAASLEARDGIADGQPELVIVGRDAMARALAKLGRVLHFTVTIVDPLMRLSEWPEADRVLHELDFTLLPGSQRCVVVASRGQFDEEAIEQALTSDAAYVALLANKERAKELLHSLRIKGISLRKIAQVRAPAGLAIGAESPEEIALSILAEIVAERRIGRTNSY
ncbi:MAG TPA: NTP transferase domain-containing protein [Candidatus Angelobacter sp.]|nr:NTP transferase domain-containing protein [Candidatus Angelobacter sp.]